mgnify:CR=1 FL=1
MIVATPAALSAWVRSRRKAKGLTQKKLAALTGLKQKTISGFECGKVDIRMETLFRILAILGLNIDLINRPENDSIW